ncbi:hypothetical protein P7D22_15570 [Lichenihabitans sp. Uapishka_5]|uniref:hypothetical protein n=1 Tax=Lichenihabitans sp. Uapishka_5 TaxID=3037302 RepID=UPI0029E82237|nr:hypothetical protein [Lichenihabitans sp. Uapishka_5]MDX7952589.1 hypothetical protein [Lichenihabitans sp. Uapishka_5]
MAIKFEDDDGGKPAKKVVGSKAYVAEEPAPESGEAATVLPFAKPVRPDKKGRKPKR